MIKVVVASDLKLGDVVRLSKSAFCDAVVSKVSDDVVTFYRPYARSEDFSVGDPPQVICLTGVEHFSVERAGRHLYKVLSRKEVR